MKVSIEVGLLLAAVSTTASAFLVPTIAGVVVSTTTGNFTSKESKDEQLEHDSILRLPYADQGYVDFLETKGKKAAEPMARTYIQEEYSSTRKRKKGGWPWKK